MKKALVALALSAVASVASANIINSAHDLSTPLNGTLGVCQYCHAPHWANTAVPGAPLWNRTLGTTADYTLYDTATTPAPANLNPNSLTCLSCHDGRQNLGAIYVGTAGTGPSDVLTIQQFGTGQGSAYIGTDLTNDHPVSVRYTGADLLGTANPAVKLYTYGGLDYVECASCHDPHVTGTESLFLRDTRANLCADCHNK